MWLWYEPSPYPLGQAVLLVIRTHVKLSVVEQVHDEVERDGNAEVLENAPDVPDEQALDIGARKRPGARVEIVKQETFGLR